MAKSALTNHIEFSYMNGTEFTGKRWNYRDMCPLIRLLSIWKVKSCSLSALFLQMHNWRSPFLFAGRAAPIIQIHQPYEDDEGCGKTFLRIS